MMDQQGKVNRRAVVLGVGMAAAAATAGFALRAGAGEPIRLRSRQTSYSFEGMQTHGLYSLQDAAPPPVLRMRQGVPVEIEVTNGVDEHTTMHWHGIRLPNAMDGVPYLTQFPIAPGERFRYAFTPPDAGTYWYHPHCMTMRQMAYGLTGLLIVEEQDDPGFDADIPLNLKDFRLDAAGRLLPYFTPRGAARGGTFGNLQTTNWQLNPRYDLPAGSLVRLRIAATDNTRVYRLMLPDIAGRVIAWDGHPLRDAIALPTAADPLWLSPGQRVDIAVQMPDTEGREVTLAAVLGPTPKPLATLRAIGPSQGRDLAEIAPLPRNPVSEPDLSTAERRSLVFGWSPDGAGQNNGFCGNSAYTFWSIDRQPWPGDAVSGTGAVATLSLGKTYIFKLQNESPNNHPIHLHGLALLPLRSNKRTLRQNWTDTILLMKGETVEVAFKADNPGDWAFHCHVIEHQKTGLAGYIHIG
ncbi:MAG: multicopper oxidase family protein [Pseudomonadota bacterium]